jgi:predicted lipid-binding transport protein (Tim44 family)
MISEASAKRFGGGRSFGVQRSYNSLFSSNKSQHTATPLGQKFNKSRWGGVLGGLLIGGLLGSLFMGNGFASGITSWLIVGLVFYFIMNLLRRRAHPATQTAQSTPFSNTTFNQFKQQFTGGTSAPSGQTADFVSESFLRNAKVCFIRLQSAYDQKNLQDIQTFTAPEVFAEIKMQLDERGNEPNSTEVIDLNAELLDISKQAYSTLASVRFTGSIKEDGEINALDEIWHFRQQGGSKEWVVDGIQQEVYGG